jgi:hypothetical protein
VDAAAGRQKLMFAAARLLGVLVVTLLAASGAAAKSPAIDTSGWKTLRDDELGFEVKHPAQWYVNRSSGSLVSVFMGEPSQVGKPTRRITFLVQRNINPSGFPIDQWYADQIKRLKISAPPPVKSTTLAGRPAMRQEITRGSSTHYDLYTVVRRGDVFQVSIVQPAEPLDPTFEAVISTLRLLE